ncbi:hypothetical protein T440DRAFT_483205 [Plenodomus tracheiphilus IPT5]|uniref:Uncharacterized protein n=1 Tax=Plenodomus tracheiphilus IPT5 TaxID=1408161 RepID=A0A6A7ATZ2_9PLEO|nr:hypothetical protein T440DRAFT_483205 [Plenodomus tracheiphilus IPT5]
MDSAAHGSSAACGCSEWWSVAVCRMGASVAGWTGWQRPPDEECLRDEGLGGGRVIVGAPRPLGQLKSVMAIPTLGRSAAMVQTQPTQSEAVKLGTLCAHASISSQADLRKSNASSTPRASLVGGTAARRQLPFSQRQRFRAPVELFPRVASYLQPITPAWISSPPHRASFSEGPQLAMVGYMPADVCIASRRTTLIALEITIHE